MDLTDPSDAFVVPRRLFAGRKRRSDAAQDQPCPFFFTSEDFASFSVHGERQESRLYGQFETRRRASLEASKTTKTRSSPLQNNRKNERKHLMQLLVEAMDDHRIEAPENQVEVENARRRLSKLAVAQHEAYLTLQRKIMDAQKRGLPDVLALGNEEATQWHDLKADVEHEQVVFCRMLARALASEAAGYDRDVPTFATSWYKAMLTQTWHELYRLYPRWFEPCLSVEFASKSFSSDAEKAAFQAKPVFRRGTCCTIDVTQLTPGQPLKTEGLALDVASPRQVISADPLAKKFMETYDCDLALSSSTLVTLFDSDTSTHFAHVPGGWGIPVKSRLSSDTTKKRIYLDRPLPGRTFGAREKVAEAGRAALLSRFELESVREGSTGGQTVYHIWQLQDKRILVRSTTHASMIANDGTLDVPHEPKKLATVPLSVFLKPDYQILGVEEQLTTSERCRFWFHSWLRGGSTVLVARLNPRTSTVSSWTTYSPESLLYGEKVLPLESIDPSAKLKCLSLLFAALGDVPVGKYLVRPQDAPGSSTFGPRRSGFEVLGATTEAEPVVVMDLYSFVPQESAIDAPKVTRSSPALVSVLPAWNLPDRIPYTFQTGTYCFPFFIEGSCPKILKEKGCECLHFRLKSQPMSAKRRWRFDNYTKVLKSAGLLRHPRPVTLQATFCGHDKDPPSIVTIADLFTPVHCSKPSTNCALPHYTLHQILERFADDLLRHERGKRSGYKTQNRQKKRGQQK